MKNPSLVKNAILNGITQICKIIFPIISFSYSAHILGSKNIGIIQFSSSIVGYFALLASLGISLYAVREGAVFRDNKEKFEKFASEIYSINIISMVISYILMTILILSWNKLSNYSIFIIINALTVFFTTVGANWINSIYEDYLYITSRFIIIQVLSIALLLLFVKTKEDLLIYTIIKAFSSSMGEILNCFYIRKYVHLKFSFKNNYKRHLKPILILFANEIAVTIFVNSDITLIGVLKNDREVGVYSTSAQLYNIVKRLVYSFITVALPRFSYLTSIGKRNEAERLYERIGNLMFLIAMPACVGMIASGKQLLYVLAGKEFVSGYIALCILSPAIIIVSFSNLFCLCALIPNKKEMIVLYASITAAIVNLVLNCILIPLFGIEAAAITTLVAELIEVIIFYFVSKKFYTFKINRKNLLSVSIGCLCIFVICKLINITEYTETVKMIFEISASASIYGFVMLLTKNEYALDLLSHIVKKLHK